MNDATSVQVTLPSELVRQAEANGLLAPPALESLLRQELKRRETRRLMDAADRLAALPGKPLTETEIEKEIQAARSERRAGDAGSRGH
jgi:post-segregation antitoxin (ccd killing protein)